MVNFPPSSGFSVMSGESRLNHRGAEYSLSSVCKKEPDFNASVFESKVVFREASTQCSLVPEFTLPSPRNNSGRLFQLSLIPVTESPVCRLVPGTRISMARTPPIHPPPRVVTYQSVVQNLRRLEDEFPPPMEKCLLFVTGKAYFKKRRQIHLAVQDQPSAHGPLWSMAAVTMRCPGSLYTLPFGCVRYRKDSISMSQVLRCIFHRIEYEQMHVVSVKVNDTMIATA